MLQSLRWNVCDIITPLLWLMATLGVHCQNGITSTTDSTGQLLLDTTVMADQRKSFFCPQDFEKPIKWFHQIDDGVNSTNLPRLPHNPPERDRSFSQMLPGPSKNFQLIGHRLSFSNVSVRDRGWYYCKDKTGRRSNKFYLFVQKPVDITDPTNISLPIEPGTVSLLCEAAGLPRPFIQWLVNGQPLPPSKFVTINKNIAAVNSSLYNVSKDKPAVYTCKAWNILDKEKEPRIALKTYTFYVAKDQGETTRTQRECLPYQGHVCDEFLRGKTVLQDGNWEEHEQYLLNVTREMEEDGVNMFCLHPALRLLCNQMFPNCTDNTTEPWSVCQESCLAVTTLFCFKEFAKLEELRHEKITRGLMSLPDCLTLPSKWNSSQQCIDSDHHNRSEEKVRGDCYVDNGRWYNGTVNVTISGRPCQRWEDNSPQNHQRSPLLFPELWNSENYCRNPGGEETQPWCYTTDKFFRWEKCLIQLCLPEDNVPNEWNEFYLIILLPILAVFLCILIISLAMFLKWKHQKYRAAAQDDFDVDVANLPVNMAYHQMKSNRLNPKLETLEFPRNDIVFIEDIGQGAFGRVFKARIICSNGNSHITGGKLSGSKHSLSCGKNCKHSRNPFSSKGDLRHLEIHSAYNCSDTKLLGEHLLCDSSTKSGEGQIIAIKMLKEDASDTIQADFEKEASLMVEFDHPNIVRLLGVCTVGKPMCLLFEYMSKGDLNEFLRLCSPDQCLRRSDASSVPSMDDLGSIDMVDQLHMARQIANGMVYISERGYVHRDLASRNCLVGNGLTVKISDFGLACSIHSMDYYHGSDKDAIPIRWMPPEAILYNKFSSQSDVWSFGVLLWEIFSFALQPYYGMTHEEVINYLRSGHTLQPTENVTSVVSELMKSCWHKKPNSRPTFTSLHKSLSVLLEEATKQRAKNSFNI
ncbi:muscle, skeletal receptor tyrosine protein kinase-like isoform X2 [Biomphalaria glabrata]|uniref:receptor protein-tyrosine kinase n=1 Tax=Biomphalaria glabrata TaxID=6526 RepID=A0A9U8E5A2_BIOGL|nr:muscle, skeletal receptor tyrosine protein kinase-like isoform X2 [Biomphalaria glabrata]